MNNAITVDVEDWFQVSLFRHHINNSDWDKMESTVTDNTVRILNLFSRYNVKATFFVLGWVAERYPELVVAMQENGHEVASHGYGHQMVFDQSPDQFQEDVGRSIEILEAITGEKVRGYRAPSYSITRDTLWALEKLVDLGIEYDSSIFPIRHDVYGVEDAPRFPFKISIENKNNIIEFPISTTKIIGKNIPIAGGGYLRLWPYWFFKQGIKRVNKGGEPTIIYFHPWEIDPHLPRINVGNMKHLRHYGNLSLMEDRIQSLLQHFKFTTVWNVLQSRDEFELWPETKPEWNSYAKMVQ
ncbi:MAG: DUF3473 domain-containing protein [Deferribacteres bacterium]|nr:DUF3473 domain-containing protein [candidate division KSB1 bacterium]MCB9501798.1 DUF3473 domain-containing protein [Deferribacteres bacterium]